MIGHLLIDRCRVVEFTADPDGETTGPEGSAVRSRRVVEASARCRWFPAGSALAAAVPTGDGGRVAGGRVYLGADVRLAKGMTLELLQGATVVRRGRVLDVLELPGGARAFSAATVQEVEA